MFFAIKITMRFQTVEDLKHAGFAGFISVEYLRTDTSVIPACVGVYMVVRTMECTPEYLEVGTGGFYKGKNPNVAIHELESNWVDATCVVYIGKAGTMGKKQTLRKRIGQYIRFGNGEDVGHYGGRLIWQLKDSSQLLFCWKELLDEEPRDVEHNLISEFKLQYDGRRPFANLQD